MSNMDKQFSIPYDSIISVTKMINSNKISMLRDKVIRNQYLTFGNLDYSGLDNDILKIFNLFRANSDGNKIFFKQFFKHYNKYIIRFNAIYYDNKLEDREGNDREQLVNEMIQMKCLPAFQVIVHDYQYIPTELNLQVVMDSGSKKFIKFILQHLPQSKRLMDRVIDFSIKFSPPIFKSLNFPIKFYNNTSHFKSLYYLHNENIIDVTKPYPTKKCKTIKNIPSKHIKSIRNQVNETTPLKDLIEISKLIFLSNVDTNLGENINNNKIESLSNGLSKQELKLPLSDPSFQTQFKKDTIKKMLDLYYSYGKFEFIPEFYHIYFNGNAGSEVEFSKDISNIRNQFKQSFRFANYKLLVHCGWVVFSVYLNNLVHHILGNKDEEFIFSHCAGDANKETRFNFINSIVNHLNEIDPTLYQNKLLLIGGVENLSLILVGYDDVELVKLLVLNNSFCIRPSVITFIKSIGMLDYLFENYYKDLINYEVSNFRNIQLLKHYETLVQSKCSTSNKIQCCPNSKTSCEVIKYILERGSSIYEFKSLLDIYCGINHYYPTDYGKFEMMKLLFTNYIFNNSNGGDYYTINIYYCRYIVKGSYGVSRFLNWLYINHKDYLKNERIESFEHLVKYNDQIPNEVYFITGRYNQINSSAPLKNLINYHFEIMDIHSLEYLCNKLQHNNNSKKNDLDSFFKMLKKVVYEGKLDLLKYIQDKHQSIFTYLSQTIENNVTTPNCDGTIPLLKDLKSLLLNSLQTNSILVSEYLFQLIELTKNEYTTNSNSIISRIYFKDKQFI